MATGEQKAKTESSSSGVVVKGKTEPEVYFHPGSATLLCVDSAGARALEQEHNFLAGLLENQKKALKNLDEKNFEAITLSETQPRKAEKLIDKAYAELNEANKNLRQELISLTKKPPEGELLDDTMNSSAIGLMELIPLKKGSVTGFKSTYVRSDKIKSHWRKYKLSEVDKKSGEASFIKYKDKKITIEQNVDGNVVKKEKTIRQSKIDPDELKKQLKDISVKFKLELVEDSNVILGDWAKEMNKSLTWPKEHKTEAGELGEEPVYHQYVDIGAQAQLMRYSQGAGLEAEFNPLTGKMKGKLEGHSSFALGEAKAQASLYVPDRLGVSLLFPARAGGVCNMGALRFAIQTVLSGSVGASLGIEIGVEMDWSGDMAKGYGIKGKPGQLTQGALPGKREFDISNTTGKADAPDNKAGAEIGVFIGAQAGANLSGAIEWFDPYPDESDGKNKINHDGKSTVVPKEKKFAAIAKIVLGVTAQAGAGGSAVFYITYVDSRFRIYCKAALCWGVGAKGSLGFEVDAASYYAFMKSFMYMLRNVDYQKLEQMMEPGSFQALCAIPLIMAARTVQAIDAMYNDVRDILYQTEKDLNDESKRVDLMNSILSNPDQLKYTPPETKGAIIAQLIDKNWVDWLDPRNQNNNFFSLNSWKIGPLKRRKQAVFMTLKWVQSQADYHNIMQHLTLSPGGEKGSKELNEQDVIKFLAIGEVDLWGWTNYGEKIKLLYNNLPVSVDPDEPFSPISEEKMAEYLAMINTQHPDDTRLA